jgi:hypothetical protein
MEGNGSRREPLDARARTMGLEANHEKPEERAREKFGHCEHAFRSLKKRHRAEPDFIAHPRGHRNR